MLVYVGRRIEGENGLYREPHGIHPENARRLRPGSVAADSRRAGRNTGHGPGPPEEGKAVVRGAP